MQKLKMLFEKTNIKYIVSVDDCYDPSETITEFDIKEFSKANKDKIIDFCNENSLDDSSETLINLGDDTDDYIESLIDDFNTELKGCLFAKFKLLINKEKNGLETFFENLKREKTITDYKTIHTVDLAKEYYKNIETYYSIDNEHRVLWLIDNDFSKTGGSPEDGRILIKHLISVIKDGHIIALSSAQTNDTDDNSTFRESLNLSNANDILLACLIRKHNIISQQYTELYNEMYLGFRQNYSGEILNKLQIATDDAAKKSASMISKLNDETINRVIFLGSKADGVSPVDTFHRLMMIILKSDISKTLGANYDAITKLIYNYSELCSWCQVEQNDNTDVNIIEQIRKNECFDYNINSMYACVGYGDIFKINEKYYLLIAQSCNIAVRDNGNRKANCATLAEIISENKSTEAAMELDYFEYLSPAFVSFNDTINIDFSALDLCSLNDTGILKLPNSFNIENFRFRYTNGAYESLRRVIQHNLNLCIKYRELESRKNDLSISEIIHKTREIFKDNTLELDVHFDTDGNITYNGQRISRLSKDKMEDIAKRYFEYHSRKALDFDFAANYRALTFDVCFDFDFSILDINSDEIELLKKYVYYKKDSDKNIQRRIDEEFSIYYAKILNVTGTKVSGHKSNPSNSKIIMKNNLIPVIVNGTTMIDVIDLKDDKIVVKLPKELIIKKLNDKGNKTYTCSNSQTVMKIGGKHVTFEFKRGQALVFSDREVVTSSLLFSFTTQNGMLALSIHTN